MLILDNDERLSNYWQYIGPTASHGRSKSAEICANGDFCSFFLLFSPLEQGHRPNIDLSSTFGINMKKKLIAEVRIRHDFDHIWSFSVKNSLLIGSGSWMWALGSLTIGNILDIDLLSNYWFHMWVICTLPYVQVAVRLDLLLERPVQQRRRAHTLSTDYRVIAT